MKTEVNKYTLFLFKRGFTDKGNQKYFCPYCLRVEGLMALFPEIRHSIDVRYIDFQPPRKALAELLGKEDQSCPVLVLETSSETIENDFFEYVLDNTYQITRTSKIIEFFIQKFGLPKAH